jgi:hypothetical protein
MALDCRLIFEAQGSIDCVHDKPQDFDDPLHRAARAHHHCTLHPRLPAEQQQVAIMQSF